MDDAVADANVCFPTNGVFSPVDDEYVNFAIYVDSNDVEGLLFISDRGQRLTYKANYNIYQPNPPAQLLGRPIGFRIEFGHTAVSV